MAAACSSEYPSEEGPDLMSLHLSGTKWQLEDIRNLKTGKSRTLEPHARIEGSYSFTFKDDTLAYGRSCTNSMYVDVKGTATGHYLGIMSMVYEGTDDCIYFQDITRLVDNSFYEKERLIFAYTQNKVRYHLRFKQVTE
jgi:hypothetical protein